MNVILTIDKVHTAPQRGPGLQNRLKWVKRDLWAQPSHSLCLDYDDINCFSKTYYIGVASMGEDLHGYNVIIYLDCTWFHLVDGNIYHSIYTYCNSRSPSQYFHGIYKQND